MRLPRISIVTLMAMVAVIALDVAVLRGMGRSSGRYVELSGGVRMGFIVYALGVLPMVSLLLVGAANEAPRAIRRGSISGFSIGFEVGGWLSIFAFMIVSALSPGTIYRAVMTVAGPLGTLILPVIGQDGPEWVYDVLELAVSAGTFLLPELLVATVAGWLVRRACDQLAISGTRADAPQARETSAGLIVA